MTAERFYELLLKDGPISNVDFFYEVNKGTKLEKTECTVLSLKPEDKEKDILLITKAMAKTGFDFPFKDLYGED
jgi:hypothetical protein